MLIVSYVVNRVGGLRHTHSGLTDDGINVTYIRNSMCGLGLAHSVLYSAYGVCFGTHPHWYKPMVPYAARFLYI